MENRLLTHLLTYLLTHFLTRFATPPPLHFESLDLPLSLPLTLNFVLTHARTLVEEGKKGWGWGAPGGASPIISEVTPTNAYFVKSRRGMFCASAVRLRHLNSRFNRVVTYFLTGLQSFAEYDSDIVKNEKRFPSFKIRIKSSNLNNVVRPNKISCRLE